MLNKGIIFMGLLFGSFLISLPNSSAEPSTTCINLKKDLEDAYEKVCNSFPKSCKDIQDSSNNQGDGEYDLYLKLPECKQSARIYCAGMNTPTPLEYVTLPSGIPKNYAVYYNHKYGNRLEVTKLEKIRLRVPEMDVVKDSKFAVSNIPGVFRSYGEAGDCFSGSCSGSARKGKFGVDITGTSFRLPSSIPYSFHSYPSCVTKVYSPSMSADHLRWSGMCGGYCGKCWPTQLSLEIQGC